MIVLLVFVLDVSVYAQIVHGCRVPIALANIDNIASNIIILISIHYCIIIGPRYSTLRMVLDPW